MAIEYRTANIEELTRLIAVAVPDWLQSAHDDKKLQCNSHHFKLSISLWSQGQLVLDPIPWGCHPDDVIGLEDISSSVDRLVLTLSVQLTKVQEINNSFDKKRFQKTCAELERWMRQEYHKLAEQADNLIRQQIPVFEWAGHGYLTLFEADPYISRASRSGISLDGGSGVKSGMTPTGTSSSIEEPELYTAALDALLGQPMLFMYHIPHLGRIQADVEYTNWITFDRCSHETWSAME